MPPEGSECVTIPDTLWHDDRLRVAGSREQGDPLAADFFRADSARGDVSDTERQLPYSALESRSSVSGWEEAEDRPAAPGRYSTKATRFRSQSCQSDPRPLARRSGHEGRQPLLPERAIVIVREPGSEIGRVPPDQTSASLPRPTCRARTGSRPRVSRRPLWLLNPRIPE
jgi:hypothetical protein